MENQEATLSKGTGRICKAWALVYAEPQGAAPFQYRKNMFLFLFLI